MARVGAPVSFDDVRAAAARIRGVVHRTPVFTSATLDAELGARVFFKAENLQKCGAFKARGAANAVLALDEDAAARGVITHSSGNHGAALAFAARQRGVPCAVVMPRTPQNPKTPCVQFQYLSYLDTMHRYIVKTGCSRRRRINCKCR